MTGLDKIIEEIKSDAQSRCDRILEDAKHKRDEIIASAQAQADEIISQGESEAEKQGVFIEERSNSAKELDRRKRLLSAKQEIITCVLDKALEKLKNLPDDKYFDVIYKLIEKNMTGDSGQIALSKKDTARLPKDFNEKLSQISSSKLTLSDETRKIDGGFVLIYGGIEENCSFKAMIDSRGEELRDFIKEKLF